MAEEPVSPTQTIVDCMEQFGEAEPEHVLVIWSTDGDIRSARSSDVLTALGMIEAMKAAIINTFKVDE